MDKYDYHFMLGYKAAMAAYTGDKEYTNILLSELKHTSLEETWSEYSEYNFAHYIIKEMPDNENHKEAVYDGIRAAMDKFLLDTYLKSKGLKYIKSVAKALKEIHGEEIN